MIDGGRLTEEKKIKTTITNLHILSFWFLTLKLYLTQTIFSFSMILYVSIKR